MEELYIKVNNNYVEINIKDIKEILDTLLSAILKKKKSKLNDNFNYSYIGNKLKQKCNNIGFRVYNKNKRLRNINSFLHKKYSGLQQYLDTEFIT